MDIEKVEPSVMLLYKINSDSASRLTFVHIELTLCKLLAVQMMVWVISRNVMKFFKTKMESSFFDHMINYIHRLIQGRLLLAGLVSLSSQSTIAAVKVTELTLKTKYVKVKTIMACHIRISAKQYIRKCKLCSFII